MTEVIEEHHHTEGGGNPINGLLVGIILVALIIFLFFVFGRGFFSGQNNNSAPSVSIPDEVDVNINDQNSQ